MKTNRIILINKSLDEKNKNKKSNKTLLIYVDNMFS